MDAEKQIQQDDAHWAKYEYYMLLEAFWVWGSTFMLKINIYISGISSCEKLVQEAPYW